MNRSLVVFFDGLCGLCDGVVAWAMPYAKKSGLLFAPLQGKAFQELLTRRPYLRQVDSLVVVENWAAPTAEKIFMQSDAVLAILGRIRGPQWTLLWFLGSLMPAFLRNALYRGVAKNRHRLFGRRQECRLPSPEESDLFLP